MKLVIPMAGFGSRMRPHTWTRPKPLLPIAGKPMLAHVLDVFRDLPITEYVFIVGWLGDQIRDYVIENYQVPAHFVEQGELIGQAHALWLAREYMQGPLITFFVDTLFFGADFSDLDAPGLDGVIYTKEIDDPRRFGAVQVDEDGGAIRLVEKPSSVENKKVMIGLYYFRDGEALVAACEELMRLGRQTKGEYFESDAVNVMIERGSSFETREVERWLDTGKPETTLHANRYLLDHGHDNSERVRTWRSVLIPPVHVAPDAVIEDSVVGPYVDVGAGAQVRNALVRNSILDTQTVVEDIFLEGSLVGEKAKIKGRPSRMNIGNTATVGFEYNVDESWQ
jgi:glucose-1-phosphate thymidylyltransferase